LKKGRRIPFMRYTAPFLALFFIIVWFAPAGSDKIAIFWWMLITTLLYDTAYTIVFLIYSALLPEITEDE
jgi:GPH family glycoside/pentoside/hexuronide:cation symporter